MDMLWHYSADCVTLLHLCKAPVLFRLRGKVAKCWLMQAGAEHVPSSSLAP